MCKRVTRGRGPREAPRVGFRGRLEGALQFAAKKGTLSRAPTMKMNGYVKTVQEAFDVSVGDGCPTSKRCGRRLRRDFSGTQAASRARAPQPLENCGRNAARRLMKEFHEAGGLGIEVCSGSQGRKPKRKLADIAAPGIGFSRPPGLTAIRSGAEGRDRVKFTRSPRTWIPSGSIFRHLERAASFLQETAINFTQGRGAGFSCPCLTFSVP